MRLYNMLFVCMGNICRSPAGEAVMRHLVEAEGLANRIHCDSAGTIAFHTGNPPDHRMHAAAANRNINTGGQARQICNDDYHSFDLILTMDDENLMNVRNMAPAGEYSAVVRPFCDFVTGSTATEVPDPYYGGQKGFETVLDLLENGCANLLEHARSQVDK
jgi:protein-tyrosine phosphatase